ncbi:hypothetical protein C1280_11840 [Gemmata obscuriglobus]|uniref:Uncharacterized protein n=1 Tax=Gemmata obscuriglobus TaxID=114 RepID=A0A2Z3H966_9BACT|nr:hypothetical protein C1280_11840 [Gemmata obscuriglobus]
MLRAGPAQPQGRATRRRARRHRACRRAGGLAGVAQTPNPALHLTPPADAGRTAHPMMAVQVSFIVRQPEGV